MSLTENKVHSQLFDFINLPPPEIDENKDIQIEKLGEMVMQSNIKKDTTVNSFKCNE